MELWPRPFGWQATLQGVFLMFAKPIHGCSRGNCHYPTAPVRATSHQLISRAATGRDPDAGMIHRRRCESVALLLDSHRRA